MKKKALAFAAAACAFGMLLSGCGSSNGSDTAAEGANIITAYNSEPQHPLIPGNTNETGGGKPVDLLFSRLISFDAKGNASNEVAESITANDHEFTVDLNKSDSVFAIKVGYSAFAPLPESFYDDTDAFGEAPVGNGPYKFQSWDHDNEIVLVKNPDYKGNRTPKNDGVTFKVYTKDDAAYADIQSGALDVMESVPASATKTFEPMRPCRPTTRPVPSSSSSPFRPA